MKKSIPIDTLHDLLSYDPLTGKLTWRFRDRRYFTSERSWKYWNGRYANTEAFTADATNGYLQGSIFNTAYRAHRVCLALHNGKWPDYVDHINGDKKDNRACNLRSVELSDNCKNLAKSKSNKSGFQGICWRSSTKKWRAYINLSGKQIEIGSYSCIGMAIKERAKHTKELGYHENHGMR